MGDPLAEQHSDLVRAKFEAAWGSCVGDFGYAPLEEAARRAYQSLYEPDQVVAGIESRYPSGHASKPLRESTRAALVAQLAFARKPDAERFVQTYVNAVLYETDMASTMFPGAREQVALAQAKGAGAGIFSAGEPRFQHEKLAAFGIVAEEPGAARDFAVSAPNTEFGPPLRVMSAIAVDKTSPENMAKVRAYAAGRPVAVVDDREGKGKTFVEETPNSDAFVVGQGPRGSKTYAAMGEGPKEHGQGRIYGIASIADLDAKLDEVYGDRRGELIVFFDVDDTISDNSRRLNLNQQAVLSGMERAEYLERGVNTRASSPAVSVGMAPIASVARSLGSASGLVKTQDAYTNQATSAAITGLVGLRGPAVDFDSDRKLSKARSLGA